MYGGVSAIALGLSLYFSADLGTRLDGFKGPASFWPGCILTWFLFHLKDYIYFKLGKTEDKYPGERWLCSSKRSMYYELFFDEDDDDEKEGGQDVSTTQVKPVNNNDNEAAAAVIAEYKEQKTHLGFSCPRF